MKDAFPNAEELIQRHFGLWAFVQLHRGELQSVMRRRQMARFRQILAETLDKNVRGPVLAFLISCRDAEMLATRPNLPSASTSDATHWLARLRHLNVFFVEHGYQISDELTTLIHWEEGDACMIIGELRDCK